MIGDITKWLSGSNPFKPNDKDPYHEAVKSSLDKVNAPPGSPSVIPGSIGIAGAPKMVSGDDVPPRKRGLVDIIAGFVDELTDHIADKVAARVIDHMTAIGHKLQERLEPRVQDDLLYGMATLDGELERPELLQPNVGRFTEEELAALDEEPTQREPDPT